MNTRRLQQGFTITELLIAVSVGSLVSLLMVTVFVFGYGSLIVAQTRASMVLESQLFLRRMTEDIRVANQVLATNTISDVNSPVGGWVTSDPANTLILTQPAVDSNDNFIYDTLTGYPYQNEVIYFGNGSNMYRRTLANTSATGNVALTTCPSTGSNCPFDVTLSNNLRNMTFVFFDIDNATTTTIANARTVELTVNLEKKAYGQTVTVQNTTRMSLRNEN